MPDGCGEAKVHLGDGEVRDLEGCIEFVNEYLGDYPEEVHRIWQEDTDRDDIDEQRRVVQDPLAAIPLLSV